MLCFSNFDQVIMEPFNCAYYWGTDRVSDQYLDRDPDPQLSFANVKAMCEQPYPGGCKTFDSNMLMFVNVLLVVQVQRTSSISITICCEVLQT